jgi:hypothetical protein
VVGVNDKGKIWVAGGLEWPCRGNDYLVESPAMLSYDIGADKWTEHEELTLPFRTSYFGEALVGNVRYLLEDNERSGIYALNFTNLAPAPANFSMDKKCVTAYWPTLAIGQWAMGS